MPVPANVVKPRVVNINKSEKRFVMNSRAFDSL